MDQTTERVSPGVGLGPGPALTGEVMGHGLFRMPTEGVASLRRSPGPIPEQWGPVHPSLLRHSDEQTIAGLCAVFTAIQMMRTPRSLRRVGHRRRLAVPRPREPGQGARRVCGRGRMGNVAASDPALRFAFGFRDDQPGPRPAWPQSRRGWGPARGGRGLSGGTNMANDGQRTGSLADTQWLVARAGAGRQRGPAGEQGMSGAGDCIVPGRCFRRPKGISATVDVDTNPVAAPIDLVALAENLANDTECKRMTVATDPLGRLRIDLIEGPTGRE